MEKKKKILATTARLPMVGKDGCTGTKAIFCRKCQKQLWIPLNMGSGHVRCPACGEIYRIGIPNEYARIVCSCGKILTAPKKLAGQYGRCPGCHRQWQIPKSLPPSQPQTERLVLQASAQPAMPISPQVPIRFKCTCGQPHMVEWERGGMRIRCFRCGQEVAVPHPEIVNLPQPIPDVTPEIVHKSAAQPLVAEGGWYFQIPYAEEDWFLLLNVSSDTHISDIKQKCRDLEAGLDREDSRFQKIQMAKDILTRPESRLWFELISDRLVTMWRNMVKNKWLALHDEAIRLHRQAIELERASIYHKAEPLWRKAAQHWLSLAQTGPFWEGLRQRGEALFDKKFTAEIAARLRYDFADRLLVQVACQFRDHYIAENQFARAHMHLEWIEGILQDRFTNAPTDSYNSGLWAQYLMEKAAALAQTGHYAKTVPILQQLSALATNYTAVERWKDGFLPLLLPHLSAKEKSKALCNHRKE
jgi:rRNA maturation protein Nop10